MLRMMLVALLIPLGVGILAAMELRTPPRAAVAVVNPLVETNVGVSDSRDVLAKADRLEITYAKSETATQYGSSVERSPPELTSIGSQVAPRIISRYWNNPKAKKAATVIPRSKPKTAGIKQTAISDRSKTASDTQPCRLSSFGGLLKALNLTGCEI